MPLKSGWPYGRGNRATERGFMYSSPKQLLGHGSGMLALKPIIHRSLEDYPLSWHGTHGVGHWRSETKALVRTHLTSA